jgi:hypothetical protein
MHILRTILRKLRRQDTVSGIMSVFHKAVCRLEELHEHKMAESEKHDNRADALERTVAIEREKANAVADEAWKALATAQRIKEKLL